MTTRIPTSPGGRRWSRRTVLAAGGVGVASLLLPGPAHAQSGSAGEVAPDGFRVLRARPGTAALRGEAETATPIWGYDGMAPGPLLRVKRGEDVKVRLVNELPEPTTIHWHGLRLPNAMDGTPHLTQAPVEPGGRFDYRFPARDAGTFWYHAHLYSSEQVERGLYGVLVVDEPAPVEVDREVVLVFDDWRLTPDGAVDEASFRSMHDAAHAGRMGEHLTINSRPNLDIPVRANERLRLRLVSAANARLMAVRLPQHEAIVMAIDGQPAEPFAARDARVVLGPGNRVDLFVDATLAPGATAPIMLETGSAQVPIARLVYSAEEPVRPQPRPLARPLPANPLPAKMDFSGALKLSVPLDGGAMRMMMRGPGGREVPGQGIDPGARIWTLSGQASSGHHGPALFSVRRGRTVMLAFANRTAFPHSMHLHGHHMRLLDALDDGWKPFWLDSVLVLPDQTARTAFVADNPGKWMLHCHMLEHQETGMAAWFEVT